MEYPELAIAEIEAMTGKKAERYGSLVFVDTNSTQLSRLACTKKIYEVLGTDINKINWNKIIKKDYCVRSNKKELEPKLGSIIWKKLKNPKVNLTNPKTKIYFFYHKNKVFILKQIKKLHHDFEQRKAHKRETLLPIAMHPKLARAMVNLANAKKIVDPFCGTGTILIEAGLMKLTPIGYDIDEKMVKLSKTNLKPFKIKAKITQADATKIKAKNIVTELPFAKNTKKQDLIKLYTAFLENCRKNKSKIIASFPNTINFKKIIKQNTKSSKNSKYLSINLYPRLLWNFPSNSDRDVPLPSQ